MATRAPRPAQILPPPPPNKIPVPAGVLEAGLEVYKAGFKDGYRAGLKEGSVKARMRRGKAGKTVDPAKRPRKKR